jgi:hypothetical protein
MQTILEVNGQKMPERIAATRAAIAGRLRDLEHDSDHHAERFQIENALRALAQLEVETQQWSWQGSALLILVLDIFLATDVIVEFRPNLLNS